MLVVHEARLPEKEKGALAKGLASQWSLSASRQLISTLNSSPFSTPVIKLEHVLEDTAGLFIGNQTHLFIMVVGASGRGGWRLVLCRCEAFFRGLESLDYSRLEVSENMTPEGGVRFGPLFRQRMGGATSKRKGIVYR